jgi:hypothetical protein
VKPRPRNSSNTLIRVSRSRLGLASFDARAASSCSRQAPRRGIGCCSRSYWNSVASDRITLRTVLRETRNSRQIALIDFPCTKWARRIRAIVSTTNIPIWPSIITRANVNPIARGGRLDADYPAHGALFHAYSQTCREACESLPSSKSTFAAFATFAGAAVEIENRVPNRAKTIIAGPSTPRAAAPPATSRMQICSTTSSASTTRGGWHHAHLISVSR